MRTFLGVVLLAASVAACTQRPTTALAATHSAAMVDSVQTFLQSFQTAFAAGQWEQVAAMYASDSRFRWMESGTVTARSAADIAGYLKQMPAGTSASTAFTETEILPLAPGLASVVTLFQTRYGDPSAGGFQFGGVMSVVAIHEPTGWRFLQGHASGPVPRPR